MKTRFPVIITSALTFTLCAGVMYAQTGDDNPTGVAGQFNGSSSVAGNYDPLTGSVMRSVRDISVPASVGEYPLAFTRTSSSRFAATGVQRLPFGTPGSWRHSYQYTMTSPRAFHQNQLPQPPSSYKLTYPDGRQVNFLPDNNPDPNQRDLYFRGPAGISDRFEQLTNPDQQTCRLLLPDGGSVTFDVFTELHEPDQGPRWIDYSYVISGMTDPHGKFTSVGTDANGDVETIREPGGRTLRLTYYQGRITQVSEHADDNPATPARRSVIYNYSNYGNDIALTSVDYYGAFSATYTYQPSNAGGTNPALLQTCDDPMYGGRMARIAYVFAAGAAHGVLQSENYSSGPGNVGTPVSTLTISGNTRTETRGDGPSRTFTYAGGYLQSWTDFDGHSFSQGHTAGTSGFVSSYTDARGAAYTTDYQRHLWTGLVQTTTLPQTPSDAARPTAQTIYGGQPGCADPNNNDAANPYYPCQTINENGNPIALTRDAATKRVTEILYPGTHPDGSSNAALEKFWYSAALGQLDVHQRKNGFYDHFQHDARGLLLYAWNPGASFSRPSGSEPKTSFTYYPSNDVWGDRVQTVTDPRGYPTTYEYDRRSDGIAYGGRGQVTKITYPGDKYMLFHYDERGRKLWAENELRERTTFTYDDYNRVLTVIQPLTEGRTATTTSTYNPTNGGSTPYAFTANAPDTVTTPPGILTVNLYDPNLRLRQSTAASGTSEAATVLYGYDQVGNRTSMTDPATNVSTTLFDARNRPMSSTSAAPFNYVTGWKYDGAGNLLELTQPDTKKQIYTYDEMNRVRTSKDPENRLTTYTWFPSGKLQNLKDPKQQLTKFAYNERDLQQQMTYPNNQIVNGWAYDPNGNLLTRPTAGGPQQFFTYDERNRPETMRWSNVIDFSDFDYDDAGRLTFARNPYSTITRQYDAGHLTLDRQEFPPVANTLPATVVPQSVVSRRTQGGAGDFDIALPLTGSAGIESRTGGSSGAYTLVLTFLTPVSVQNVAVTSGLGSVISTTSVGSQMVVNLDGVSNAQRLTVTFSGLNDGVNTGDLVVPIHFLAGDVNANATVNATDKAQVQASVGQPVTAANFRLDVTGDGSISSADVAVVKAGSGSAVPPAGPPSRIVDVVYLYDSAGRRDRIVAGTDYDFTYRYDEMGRLKRIFRTALPSAVYRYDYDVNSNVTARVDELRGTTLGFVPDELNRIKERVITLPGAAGGEVSHERYGYDAMSRLTTTNRDEDGLRDGFAYNDAGELTTTRYGQQWNGTAWVNPNRSVDYVLDDAGNRDSVIEGGTHDYVANALNQYTTAADQPATHGSQHELSNHAGVDYHYLADTYLSEVVSAVGTMRFGYDALGRRVKKTEGAQTPGESTTWFAYDGAHAIVESSSDGTAIANTLYGQGADELIARNNYGTAQYFHQDRLGNVTMVTGGDGSILETYRYDAFGAPTIKSPNGTTLSQSAINNRFLFTGREWVPQYGFYEYRARAYNPALGRFMSEDPMGFSAGDTNLYRYGGGDPVNKTDPSGLDTYIGARSLSGTYPQPVWSNNFLTGHQFVFTTNPNGSLAHTYGWGENRWGMFVGYWANGADTHNDTTAATALIQTYGSQHSNGSAWQGNSALDPFIAIAFAQLQSESGHANLWATSSCRTEAEHLVATAQFLQSRFLFNDNSTGAPVFSARAVSGFTADGRPIYVDTTPWESAGYADAASYAAARQESALQYANAQAVPTWDPFYQSDFNTIFAGHNPGLADGVGGAYLTSGGH